MSRFKLSGLAKLAKGFGARIPMSKARTTQAAANFRKRAKAKRNANKNRSANFAGRYSGNPTAKERRIDRSISKRIASDREFEYDPETGTRFYKTEPYPTELAKYKGDAFERLMGIQSRLERKRRATGRDRLENLSKSPNKKKIARSRTNAFLSELRRGEQRYENEKRRTGIPF